jgi:hypothetical protein
MLSAATEYFFDIEGNFAIIITFGDSVPDASVHQGWFIVVSSASWIIQL